jgi:hypothetical protein
MFVLFGAFPGLPAEETICGAMFGGVEPRQLLLRVFVEGTDPGSLPVLVQFDDIEHAVAVLTSIEECVASGAGE